MATIRQRQGKWQVQIRRQYRPTRTQTFILRADALRWAKQIEIELDKHEMGPDRSILRKLTLADLLKRFRDDVCPQRRRHKTEITVINAFLRHELAGRALAEVSAEGFAEYRDLRLRSVKASTINRELGFLQRILEVARIEWSIPLTENPIKAIQKPKAGKPRDRRLKAGELERLSEAAGSSRNRLIEPLASFAIETGMRRGELLRARWTDIDWEASTLPKEKRDPKLMEPLKSEAQGILAWAVNRLPLSVIS